MQRFIAIALFSLLGCAADAPLGPEPAIGRLTIDNPRGLAYAIVAVGSEDAPVAAETTAARLCRRLRRGAYVVRAQTPRGEVRWAAPIFPELLGGMDVAVSISDAGAGGDDEWRRIPNGPALIGDELGVGQEDERPARVVDVPTFFIAAHETTNAQYAAFLNAQSSVDPSWAAFDSKKFGIERGADGRFQTSTPAEPVVTVSLAGADAYLAWRTTATGIRHRLPSEIEWEKAARGPESYAFAYGATYRRFAANQESGRLRAVGDFAPNGFGLYDMTGNAFEWTSDVYRRDRFDPQAPGVGPAGFPPDQALRGGSFTLDGMYLRNAFRMRQRPNVRTDDIGFRAARDDGDVR